MPVLFFSDLLTKVGLAPEKVKLIRHALSDKGFRSCYEKNMVLEYTRQQKPDFSRGYTHWAIFISDAGNYAKFYALYQVGPSVPDTPNVMPAGFPHPDWFAGKNAYFDLTPVDLLGEYEQRLVIDWGKSARMWHQRGTTEKPIVAIQTANRHPFVGFEQVVLSYHELKEVVENATDYEAWHTALSSVNAVYLITDTQNGKQYVGSAYGKDGLLGRWRYYVDSLHGNNKRMRQLLCDHPDRYQFFQFSILQLLPKTATDEEVIHTESLWKKKLLSIPFGMNDN